jgi:hypothetical protein
MVDPEALAALRRKPDPGCTLRDTKRLRAGRLEGGGTWFD